MSNPLAAAIARRNVEPDGRVWYSGAIVIPSAAVVKKLTIQTRAQMADRRRILRALRALPVDADVTAVRAVLPVDSRETTREEAIDVYMARQLTAAQYLEDLETARHEWARWKYK